MKNRSNAFNKHRLSSCARGIVGGIAKVLPFSPTLSGCKKVSPTMLSWQITGSTASTLPTPSRPVKLPSASSFFFVRPLSLPRPLSSFAARPFFFFLFIDNRSTGKRTPNQQRTSRSEGAWKRWQRTRLQAPGAIKPWLDFFSTTGGGVLFWISKQNRINLTNPTSNRTRNSCVMALSNFDLTLSLCLCLRFD